MMESETISNEEISEEEMLSFKVEDMMVRFLNRCAENGTAEGVEQSGLFEELDSLDFPFCTCSHSARDLDVTDDDVIFVNADHDRIQSQSSNADASVIIIDDDPLPAKQPQPTQTTSKCQSSANVTPIIKPLTQIICSVCMDSVMNKDPTTTICGHIFCLACIKTAVQINKKCPICNRSLNKNKYHRIYF